MCNPAIEILVIINYVVATTVISDSPVHSQPGSSKENVKVKQLGESQLLVYSDSAVLKFVRLECYS